MWRADPSRLVTVLALMLCASAHAHADTPMSTAGDRLGAVCEPAWLRTFGADPTVPGEILATTVFDDGNGPALYLAGRSPWIGGLFVGYISEWEGTTWGAPMEGPDKDVRALCVFDDGGGPALYAAGSFALIGDLAASRIAKWDGRTWSALGSGMNGDVRALCVFDDGDGPALYAGGSFTVAGGVAASRIARWDGRSWSALGSGVDGDVRALCVFDDGDGRGPALHVGGSFTAAGGSSANRIAAWDGATWSTLGSGMNSGVYALTVFDDGDGGGPSLYAGGFFTTAGAASAVRIAQWDGTTWSPLGSGMNLSVSEVRALAVFDDDRGGGVALYAGGTFTTAGGLPASRIARWDGASWSPLESGVSGAVNALAVFDDDGDVPVLYAAGGFASAGGVAVDNFAKWNGASWSAPSNGIQCSGLFCVGELCVFDDGKGGGPALYVGGDLEHVGGVTVNGIARWNGESWSPLGTGLDGSAADGVRPSALAVFDDGNGPALYVAGNFEEAGGLPVQGIARWDGASWSALAGGEVAGTVFAMTVFDDGRGDGPALYAGGFFLTAGGSVVNHVARWDGATWSALGGGVNEAVVALGVHDDDRGGGPALYAGGAFTSADGAPASRVARWDGAKWSGLGDGTNGQVDALQVYDDGGGAALFAAGAFTSAGAVDANFIAKWDGASWTALGSGVDYAIAAMTVFERGSGGGPELVVAGAFATAGGGAARAIAKWNGVTWSALGGGLTAYALALAVFDDGGGGPALYAGGSFTANDSGDEHLARWGCPPSCAADVDSDGDVSFRDLLLVLANWGACAGCAADVDGDGAVGFVDLFAVLSGWGACS